MADLIVLRWALTVWQPWADLIMAGVKDVENRGWEVPWQCGGRVLRWPSDASVRPFRLWVHAGQKDDPNPAAWRAFDEANGWEPIDPEHGALLGTVLVTGCHHADDADECWRVPSMDEDPRDVVPLRHCSRWAEPGAYHWTLADPRPLDEPVPMRGRQRLWRLPDDIDLPEVA